jgi:ElaB/YqjD/DUF883 family membrane-anchored ribosome-binding protein
MPDKTFDELNDTATEAPGGTQATHSAIDDDMDELTDHRSMRNRVTSRVRTVADASRSYVREHDVGEMRSDLEREIRDHPLKSIAIALGCGYILAKLLD